jgi:ectoine hydroxylase-related dioxygenase (phytanoyl-CoA dioxygenase family)
MAQVLSAAEARFYHEHGYLIPDYRLPAQMVARMAQLTDELITRNPQLGDLPMVCPHMVSGGSQLLRGDRAWLEFSTHPPILDLVEQLIGADIILWGTNLFAKPAAKGRRIPFHRDGQYWPIEPLATATVWIAVEDCDPSNGCLRVVPDSHNKREVGTHYSSARAEDLIPETLADNEYRAADAIDIVLKAGQMVVFDIFTIHGSNPNPSARRRVGYAMRYMPASSHYRHDTAERRDQPSSAHHTRPLFLLRGVDRCGANDFRIGHPHTA